MIAGGHVLLRSEGRVAGGMVPGSRDRTIGPLGARDAFPPEVGECGGMIEASRREDELGREIPVPGDDVHAEELLDEPPETDTVALGKTHGTAVAEVGRVEDDVREDVGLGGGDEDRIHPARRQSAEVEPAVGGERVLDAREIEGVAKLHHPVRRKRRRRQGARLDEARHRALIGAHVDPARMDERRRDDQVGYERLGLAKGPFFVARVSVRRLQRIEEPCDGGAVDRPGAPNGSERQDAELGQRDLAQPGELTVLEGIEVREVALDPRERTLQDVSRKLATHAYRQRRRRASRLELALADCVRVVA